MALEYLGRIATGAVPDLEAYLGALPDDESRREFTELVGAAQWAEQRFPVRMRPAAVIASRYRLRRELGAGGFAKVWEAEDLVLGRRVALKVLNHLASSPERLASIQGEVAALARLQHRGILKLHDRGQHDGVTFLVTEVVPGRSLDLVLAELAAAGKWPTPDTVRKAIGVPCPEGENDLSTGDWPRTAVRIVVEVLWALAAAHAVYVVHRDLKPSNVMLTGSGRPVLLDFGLAGLTDRADGTLTGRLFGTRAYVAPEQLSEERAGKDVRSDVYQAGLLLYELLTLRPAFAATDSPQLLTAIREGHFAAPRQLQNAIPADLEDVCLRALERVPAARYPTADAFRADLELWLDGESPAAARGGTLARGFRRLRRGVHRHRQKVAVATALLMGMIPAAYFALRPDLILAKAQTDEGVVIEVSTPSYAHFLLRVRDKQSGKEGYVAGHTVDAGGIHQPTRLDPTHHRPLRVEPDPDFEDAFTVEAISVMAFADPELSAERTRFDLALQEECQRLKSPLTAEQLASLLRNLRVGSRGEAGTINHLSLADVLGETVPRSR